MPDTPDTPDNSDQPQGRDASDQSQPKNDSSGKCQRPYLYYYILTIKGTQEVKGNDPVKKEEGANVQLVQVDERGYQVKVRK